MGNRHSSNHGTKYYPVPPPPPGLLYPENGLSPNRQDPLQANNFMAPWTINRPPILQSPYPVPYYINELNMGLRSAIPAPFQNTCGNRELSSLVTLCNKRVNWYQTAQGRPHELSRYHFLFSPVTANPSPVHPVGCGIGVEANLWYRRTMEGWPCLWALRTTTPSNLGYPTIAGYQALPSICPTPATPLPPQRFAGEALHQVLSGLNMEYWKPNQTSCLLLFNF